MFGTLVAFLVACNDDQYMKLKAAVSEGQVEFFDIVNKKVDGDGYTLLTRALVARRYMCAAVLLEYGASPNKVDGADRSPLSLVSGNPTVLRLLLSHGHTATLGLLDQTFSYLDDDAAKCVIDKIPGFDPNRPFSDGVTPLARAVGLRLVGTITYLIKKGARKNAVDAKGQTVAHIAAYKYKECGKPYDEILNVLVECGCSMTIRDAVGLTPGCVLRNAILGQYYTCY